MLRVLISDPVVLFAAPLSASLLIFLVVKPELGFLIAPMVVALLPILTTSRASAFEAALPVTALRMSMLRIGIALILVCLPVVAWIGTVQTNGTSAFPFMFDRVPAWQLVVLAAATLLTLLPHAIRPGVLGLSLSRVLLGPYVAVAAVCAVGIRLDRPLLLFAFLTFASAITFAFIWQSTPPSYQLAPIAPSGRAPRAGLSTSMPRTENVAWWRPILRSVPSVRAMGGFAIVGFMGISDSWLLYFVMFSLCDAFFSRLENGWMRALPIPRHALLWITLVPILLPLLGVLLVGKIAMSQIPGLYADLNSIDDGAPHAFSRAPDFDRHTKVPLTFWKLAPDERHPVIRAPWGETSEADTMSVLGRPFYNPYSARKQNSERFREWQFGRATTAVYGHPLSLAEYDAKDFVPPPRVTSSPRMYILGGALSLTLALLVAWGFEFTSWHRLGRRPRLQTAIGMTLWGLGFALIVGVDLYYSVRHGSAAVIPLTKAWLMTVGDRLTMPVVLIAALVPVIATYALLQWQFNRSEWATPKAR